jgi:hypothetical protein
MRVSLAACLPFAFLVCACGESEFTTVDRCFIRLAVIEPDPAVLHRGEEVVLHAALTASPECLPPDATPSTLRWFAENPMIASVDSLTGRVTARQAGATQVLLRTARTRTQLTSAEVRVSAP